MDNTSSSSIDKPCISKPILGQSPAGTSGTGSSSESDPGTPRLDDGSYHVTTACHKSLASPRSGGGGAKHADVNQPSLLFNRAAIVVHCDKSGADLRRRRRLPLENVSSAR